MVVGAFLQRLDQALDRTKLQTRIAPLQFADRPELVVADRLCHGVVQRLRLSGDTKGAVVLVAPGAARDLGQFLGHQVAHPNAVEFGQRRKGDVIDIKV